MAKRKNQTVMTMVRCMIMNKKIPKSFCPKAVVWTFYVLNRCPAAIVKKVTPQEAWNEVKPLVEHFRVFFTFHTKEKEN